MFFIIIYKTIFLFKVQNIKFKVFIKDSKKTWKCHFRQQSIIITYQISKISVLWLSGNTVWYVSLLSTKSKKENTTVSNGDVFLDPASSECLQLISYQLVLFLFCQTIAELTKYRNPLITQLFWQHDHQSSNHSRQCTELFTFLVLQNLTILTDLQFFPISLSLSNIKVYY